MTRNALDRETSPYLLQHKDNPVHWQPWSAQALAAAGRDGKPILLSIGYAACHWCHVMAHESFEDAQTAALMNELFVSIKVDREERPDLDVIYQTALALLGQQGGWPLTMFLTPAGEPFWGGTYFPPHAAFGRPAFRDVLASIAEVYRKEPQKIASNVGALRDALSRLSRPQAGAGIEPGAVDQVAARLLEEVDTVHGGIGGAPKFPQPSMLELLWRAWKRTGNERCRDAVTITLTRMSLGGIYDHLGGGFARYSVDERWLVPHFEKMLYDNGQLLDLLTLVWQERRDPLYQARIRETAEWALREMRAAPGPSGRRAFASSLDADSEGEEGKFYVWTEAEIDRELGADSALFKSAYDVTPHGNWEGRTILNRSAGSPLADASREARLAACRARLLAVRAQRIRPGWDDKVLADWNGLMIAALARSARVFGEERWRAAAAEAFDFVATDMTADGRLRHSWRQGRAQHPATLDDYANMGRSAIMLHEATAENRYLDRAEAWLEVLEAHYADRDKGGYFLTADDTTDVIIRTKSASDSAVPSGNGTLLGVLARLFYLTGKRIYWDRAERLVAAFAGEASRNPLALATLLNNAELLRSAVQIVVIGQSAAADTNALLRAVYERSLPNGVLTTRKTDGELPMGHPAFGKSAVNGRATAYVCRGQTCSLPILDPKGLGLALAHG